MPKKKLIINDEIKTTKPRFNTKEALLKVLEPEKVEFLMHKAMNVILISAKDSGKTYPINVAKIYGLEKDPKASCVTLMKYSLASGKKGASEINKLINELKEDFHLPREYQYSDNRFYRLPKGRKNTRDMQVKLASQSMIYGSYEKSDAFTNFSISNGGYVSLIHIEEPVLQDESNKPVDQDEDEWRRSNKTLMDNITRSYYDYKNKYKDNPEVLKKIVPLKILMSLNDWQMDHPISIEAEHYFPRANFLNWVLGMDYHKLLEKYSDKINGKTIIPELEKIVSENWEELEKNILENHTKGFYIYKNEFGEILDKLFIRMTKMANPTKREKNERRDELFNKMYFSLIRGDSFELARVFGMGYDGSSLQERYFVLKDFRTYDTEELISQEKNETERRTILAFSLGWDHDANRGPVATPVTLSGMPENIGTYFKPEIIYNDLKVMVHEQVKIEGYGREGTRMYHEEMIKISKELYEKYVVKINKDKKMKYGKTCIFDNSDNSYAYRISDKNYEVGYDYSDIIERKDNDIEDGGYGIKSRDKMVATALDTEELIIDKKNKELISFIKRVTIEVDSKSDKKRSRVGIWGKRFKDLYDSMCYAIWPMRFELNNGMNKE